MAYICFVWYLICLETVYKCSAEDGVKTSSRGVASIVTRPVDSLQIHDHSHVAQFVSLYSYHRRQFLRHVIQEYAKALEQDKSSRHLFQRKETPVSEASRFLQEHNYVDWAKNVVDNYAKLLGSNTFSIVLFDTVGTSYHSTSFPNVSTTQSLTSPITAGKTATLTTSSSPATSTSTTSTSTTLTSTTPAYDTTIDGDENAHVYTTIEAEVRVTGTPPEVTLIRDGIGSLDNTTLPFIMDFLHNSTLFDTLSDEITNESPHLIETSSREVNANTTSATFTTLDEIGTTVALLQNNETLSEREESFILNADNDTNISFSHSPVETTKVNGSSALSPNSLGETDVFETTPASLNSSSPSPQKLTACLDSCAVVKLCQDSCFNCTCVNSCKKGAFSCTCELDIIELEHFCDEANWGPYAMIEGRAKLKQ